MKREYLLPINLQFFSEEGESGEVSTETAEVAEPQEGDQPEAETGEENAGAAEPQQTPEQNAIYANMRRRAEAEAQRKYDARIQELDRQFATAFGSYNTPTGAPIRTAQDYLTAFQAQQREQANAALQEAGLDPSLIDKAIAASPIMQQAQAAVQENQEIRVKQMLEQDLQAIMAIDPTIRSEADLYASENIMQAIQMVQTTGISLADAYKLANFDRLSTMNTEAAAQKTINASRSKGHLAAAAGVISEDGMQDIPQGELAKWQQWFPDKTKAELRKLYNQTL